MERTSAEHHRIGYFRSLALQHKPEMRLLLQGGKLDKRGGWRNVAEHQLVQLAATDVLADLIDLPPTERAPLIRVALVHDWNKRKEIRPGDFSQEESARAEALLTTVQPDPTLIEATGTGFNRRILDGQATFPQMLQFYIDDIAKGSEIVPFDERIAEVEARRQDLNNDPDLTTRLGGRYWDVERAAGHLVEQKIFEMLQARGVAIDKPADIPSLIRRTIESKYAPVSLSVSTLVEKQAHSGDRINEDAIVVFENEDRLVAGVVDGASALHTITSINDQNKQKGYYVSQLTTEFIKNHTNDYHSARELLLAANQELASQLLELGIDPDKADPTVLPTASGAGVALIDKRTQSLDLALAGDVVLITVNQKGQARLVIPPDVPHYDILSVRQAQMVAHQTGTNLKEAFNDPDVAELMLASRAYENHPNGSGSGALNGKQSLEKYIRTAALPLANLASLIILSDGLLPPTINFEAEPDVQLIANIIASEGLKGLHCYVVAAKETDPSLNYYPRFKQHDDTSGIVISIQH